MIVVPLLFGLIFGCQVPEEYIPGGTYDVNITSGDFERQFKIHLPPGFVNGLPVVIDFHGYSGTAEVEEIYSGWSEKADEENFIVVYPQGKEGVNVTGDYIVTSWNTLFTSEFPEPYDKQNPPPLTEACAVDWLWDEYMCFESCASQTGGCTQSNCFWTHCYDDMQYTLDLLTTLKENFCPDEERINISGISNGALMVYALAMEMSSEFAAVVPVGGLPHTGWLDHLAPSTALSLMHIHGLTDFVIPPAPSSNLTEEEWYWEPWYNVLGAYGEAYDCDQPITMDPYDTGFDHMDCYQVRGCPSQAPVVACLWDGYREIPVPGGGVYVTGHWWPLNFTTMAWKFMQDKRRANPCGDWTHMEYCESCLADDRCVWDQGGLCLLAKTIPLNSTTAVFSCPHVCPLCSPSPYCEHDDAICRQITDSNGCTCCDYTCPDPTCFMLTKARLCKNSPLSCKWLRSSRVCVDKTVCNVKKGRRNCLREPENRCIYDSDDRQCRDLPVVDDCSLAVNGDLIQVSGKQRIRGQESCADCRRSCIELDAIAFRYRQSARGCACFCYDIATGSGTIIKAREDSEWLVEKYMA